MTDWQPQISVHTKPINKKLNEKIDQKLKEPIVSSVKLHKSVNLALNAGHFENAFAKVKKYLIWKIDRLFYFVSEQLEKVAIESMVHIFRKTVRLHSRL